MSKVMSDPAQTEGILQNGSSCNDQGSVVAREVKVIAPPTSEPSIPGRLWFGIQASRSLDSGGDGQTDFTGGANGARREKSSVIGRSSLQTRIKRSLDIDGQPNFSHPESPVFGNYSDLQFPDCEIIDGDKGHGKASAWGAKIGSVLAIPMRRIDSRKKSIDSRKSAQSGLDTLGRERNPSKAQPDLCPGEHDISMGSVRSPSPTHTSIEETLYDGQPSPRGETHHPTFRNTGFGSSVGSSHQSPPAQSQSRMRQSFSKCSDKITTWGVSPGRDSDRQGQPFASRKFSLSDPPKIFKSRLNRFLRPDQENDNEDRVPANALHDEGSSVPPGASHMATLGTSTNSEQLPPVKSGLKGNLARGINSARKRMSLPFIFGSDVAVAYPPVETLGSRAVPPEPPSRMGVTPSALPGHSFLAPEAKSVTVSSTPPFLEHNHVTQEWTLQDLRDMNIIQSSPPDFPRYEDSPPQPPPRAVPIAPEINDVTTPFKSKEYIPEEEAGGDTPKASGASRDITMHHKNSYPGDPKGGPKLSSDTNELDTSAALRGISPLPEGKPIELLEEEERRNRRDSRVMGLNPETIPGDDRLAGQADEDGRRDTYGAAIREIAGLDLTLRGPPALHSNNLGDVSGSSSVANNFPSPVLQLGSNDELAVTFLVTPPSDSSESGTMAVTRTQPYNLFPRPGVTSASNTLTTQFTITPALTAVPTISTPSQSQQHLLISRGISSSFIVEELSSRVYVMVAPQQMVAPVTVSLGSREPSSPETPLLGNGRGFDGGNRVSVSTNGDGGVNVSPYHLGEQAGGGEEEEEDGQRRG